MFPGKAVQQMWGDKWGRCGAAHDEVAAWLAELRDAELPPVDVAVQECVLAPIQERVHKPPTAPYLSAASLLQASLWAFFMRSVEK